MKQLRTKVLERVIKHTIHGEKDRAARLMEALMAAIGSQLVNEANYGDAEDPMFPARRELQRELEDDLEQDRVDSELDGGLPTDPAAVEPGVGEDDDCSAAAVAQMISDLVQAGGLDEDKLAQIVDIIVGGEDEGLTADPEVDPEVDPVDPAAELPPAADNEVAGDPPAPVDDTQLKL